MSTSSRPFPELLMHYVWEHRLWPGLALTTVDGRRVEVINPGVHNTGPGPDFLNAVVRIDRQQWAGNVEMHVAASDWYRHGHNADHAYDSVVLHVVDRDDMPVTRNNGERLAQVCLPCTPDFYLSYRGLVDTADKTLPCARMAQSMEGVHLSSWFDALAAERLMERIDKMQALLQRAGGDWDQAAYAIVARALGHGVNAEPMERLAFAAPLEILRKHADDRALLEAILFGQAGMLTYIPEGATEYTDRLKQDFRFAAAKFSLTPFEPSVWRMGSRPQSFPQRRIAMLAALVSTLPRPADALLNIADEEGARRVLAPDLSPFWRRRYTFKKEESVRADMPTLSRQALMLLIINAVVPVMAARGYAMGDAEAPQRALELLDTLPPESNSIVTLFTANGMKAPSALRTQAMLTLRRNYCLRRRCLYCRIGHRMLAAKALRPREQQCRV